MRHNSRPVIVAFSCGSARAEAGGERYYYQPAVKADALLSDMALFLWRRRTRTFLRLPRFLAPQVKPWLHRRKKRPYRLAGIKFLIGTGQRRPRSLTKTSHVQ